MRIEPVPFFRDNYAYLVIDDRTNAAAIVDPGDAAPVLAIDHDQRFKTLLETFFFEFLELFFPTLAASIAPDSIEFLQQEVFASLVDGAEYHADIVVKARFKETPAFLIVHIEHQSTTPREFPRRFCLLL